MGATYDGDVIAWADEQAALIRARRFDELDLEHLADEIEDVGKAERRELVSRMALLVMHLLKWQVQPDRCGSSWERTIREQRRRIGRALEQMPSLRPMLDDPDWVQDIWADGTAEAARETGLELETFPETCPWPLADVIRDGWMPA